MKRVIGAIVAGALCAIATLTGCGMDRDEFDREIKRDIAVANDIMKDSWKDPRLSDYAVETYERGWRVHLDNCHLVDSNSDGKIDGNGFRWSTGEKLDYRLLAKPKQVKMNQGQLTGSSPAGEWFVVSWTRDKGAQILYSGGPVVEHWCIRGSQPFGSKMSSTILEDGGDVYIAHYSSMVSLRKQCVDVELDNADMPIDPRFERMPNEFDTNWGKAKAKLKSMNAKPAGIQFAEDWYHGGFYVERLGAEPKATLTYRNKPIKRHECVVVSRLE